MQRNKLVRLLSLAFVLLVLLQTAHCVKPEKSSLWSLAIKKLTSMQKSTSAPSASIKSAVPVKPTASASAPVTVSTSASAPSNCKELKQVACYAGKNEGYFCSKKDQTTTEIRWFYDKGACRKFNYKGCYGNRNRFCTKESCELRCGEQD